MLFVTGATEDPNLHCLARRAQERGVPVQWAAVDRLTPPALVFDPASGQIALDGEAVHCTAAFIRPDAFLQANPTVADQVRSSAWFSTLWAWLSTSPDVDVFNRAMAWAAVNKPVTLRLARECGLAVPQTLVTNDLREVRRRRPEWAVKPVDGGGYCRAWSELAVAHPQDVARLPVIFQERLDYPELRVFVVGRCLFAYEVCSPLLDYRRDPHASVRPVQGVPREIEHGLLALAGRLGLDFAAADFKHSPEQARLVFLEINSSPMFAAFDALDGGRLSNAMVDALCAGRIEDYPAAVGL